KRQRWPHPKTLREYWSVRASDRFWSAAVLSLSRNSKRTPLTKKPASAFSIWRILILSEGVLMVFFEVFWSDFRVSRQTLLCRFSDKFVLTGIFSHAPLPVIP